MRARTIPTSDPEHFCEALRATLKRLQDENRDSELSASTKRQIANEIKRIIDWIDEDCASKGEP